MTLIRKLLLWPAATISLIAIADVATFDREAWKSDYARLKTGMAQGYANLDWQVDHRGLDLVALDKDTSNRLDGAYSHVQAYLAIKDFVAEFRDPHLRLAFGKAPDAARAVPVESNAEGQTGPTASCGNYEAEDLATSLAYPSIDGWRQVESNNFPAGLIGDTGFVRVAEFGEGKYRSACEESVKPGMDERALQLATRATLNRELKATLAALKTAGAKRLVIDVTGNGGGSEWSTEMAALFGSGEMTRQRPILANPKCDRSAIWRGEKVCSVYGDTPQLERMIGENIWDGPILLLGDRNSASATEEFIVWLRDNGRASFAGEQTMGAGCGYINGGHTFGFTAVSLHIMMPNCSRFTQDGRNEIEGIAPDFEVNWAGTEAADYPALLDRMLAR